MSFRLQLSVNIYYWFISHHDKVILLVADGYTFFDNIVTDNLLTRHGEENALNKYPNYAKLHEQSRDKVNNLNLLREAADNKQD